MDAEKLVEQIRGQKENDGIIVWPEFSMEKSDAVALLTAAMDEVRREAADCTGCEYEYSPPELPVCETCRRVHSDNYVKKTKP